MSEEKSDPLAPDNILKLRALLEDEDKRFKKAKDAVEKWLQDMLNEAKPLMNQLFLYHLATGAPITHGDISEIVRVVVHD